MKAWALAMLATTCGCTDDFAAGVNALRDGRNAQALLALTAAEQAAGTDAPAELIADRALAALRVGQLRVAEFSAEKIAARGGPAFEPLRDFLLGNAAFGRCARARAEAELTDADPTALARAISHAERARTLWRSALMSRADWPQARRNLERVAAEITHLHEQKRRADAERKRKRARQPNTPEPQPQPPPQGGEPDRQTEREVAAQSDPSTLTATQLEQLLGLLERKEAEKRELRRSQRRARDAGVERDW